MLFKNATAIEPSKRVDVVMMDKTDTLTLSAPEFIDLVVEGMSETDALALVATGEREAEHPLAQAVVRHADTTDAARWDVEGFPGVARKGAVAAVNDHHTAVGTTSLMDDESVALGTRGATHRDLAAGVRTAVLASVEGRAVAAIGIADAVRPNSAAAVAERPSLESRW